jgi:hypothetical protein
MYVLNTGFFINDMDLSTYNSLLYRSDSQFENMTRSIVIFEIKSINQMVVG